MDTLGLLLRVACSLAAVLGLVWMVRRGMLRSGGGRARAAVGSMTVLARQQLTSRASVALVQVGGTGLVLGVTDSSVQVLASSPVDELLRTPLEAPPAPRTTAVRPAGRRLLPTARREPVALPGVLLPAAPAAAEPVPDAAPPVDPPVVPAAAPALVAEPLPALVPDPSPSPAAGAGAGLEPLYEELRRRALDALPRQERREDPLAGERAAPQTGAPAPSAAGFEASLDLELTAEPLAQPVARPDGAGAAPRRARHARTGARSGAARSGPLGGSALSPATWTQAVDVLRERAGRR